VSGGVVVMTFSKGGKKIEIRNNKKKLDAIVIECVYGKN